MKKYIPNIYQKSIYTVDYSKLLSRGIKCLLFDLDNTIVPSNSNELPNKAKDLFISLKQKGFKIVIFSNSTKSRVQNYKNFFEVDGVHMAFKPLSRKFKKIMKKYGFTEKEIAIIGDQIMTDIMGGNKMGITTVLVNPVTKYDHFFARINRVIERHILKKLAAKNLFEKDNYYD